MCIRDSGETVRETANMISFMADVIGIRDDMYIGKGNAYMHTVSEAVQEGYRDGVLEQRPTLVNLLSLIHIYTPAIRYRKEAETRREQGRTQDTSDPPDGPNETLSWILPRSKRS